MPSIVETLAQAKARHLAGDLDAAEQLYERVLAADPASAEAQYLCAVACHAQGKLDRALACLEHAVRLNPKHAESHHLLAVVLAGARRFDEAIANLQRARELRPDSVEIFAHLQRLLAAQEIGLGHRAADGGNLDEAAAHYARAAQFEPDNLEAHQSLGVVFSNQRKFAEAAACFRRSAQLKPDFVEAWYNLGAVVARQGRISEAVAAYRRALELNPELAEAHNNLALLARDQDQLDVAAAGFRRAIELKPNYADAHDNLGLVLMGLNRLDESAASFRRSLELDPTVAEAHVNYSLNLLLAGKLAEGWVEHEWRWKRPDTPEPPLPQPRWTGEPLDGRTILLRAEQGLGDTIHFVRYARLLKERGARVVVECQPPLARLLARCGDVDRVVPRGEPLGEFDVHLPMLSLPAIFRTSLSDIPAEVPYLAPDDESLETWRRALEAVPLFKIGIAWQGNPSHTFDRLRSFPLIELAGVAGVDGVRLYSLQMGEGREQLAEVAGRWPINDLGDRLGDFHNTAAIVRNLDLVIACDSAPAHLAGALGVPVWLALMFSPDWRWMLDREDSPWYPTMRLFRQSRPGDWAAVFERMREALATMLARDPRAVAAQSNRLGNELAAQGKFDEAVACYRRAVQARPDYALAHNNLAVALKELGQLDEAAGCCRRAIELAPDCAEAYYNLATVAVAQREPGAAKAALRRAIELKPDFPEAHNNLALVLKEQGRLAEAEAAFRHALALAPGRAEVHNNLATVLFAEGKLAEAEAGFRRAVELDPLYAAAHNNLGMALKEQNRPQPAVASFRRALELNGDDVESHFNLASALLVLGRLAEGWPEYEWRWKYGGLQEPRLSQPRWTGTPLAGRTILLLCEQGFGDSLQFIRFAEVLKRQGATVLVECRAPLARLLERVPGVDRVIVQGQQLPPFDCYMPLLSVPGVLRTSLETLPANVPYLSPDDATIATWRRELSAQTGFKIGIAWQGNPSHHLDRLRSFPLIELAGVAHVDGVRLYSLQMGEGREQLAEFASGWPIIDLGDRLGDFHNTAAIMHNLDLVIACDSASAHLAGALGVPVWLALMFSPDWRWMLDREDSPWYPTMRLFRQSRPGVWAPVFERMREALAMRLEGEARVVER